MTRFRRQDGPEGGPENRPRPSGAEPGKSGSAGGAPGRRRPLRHWGRAEGRGHPPQNFLSHRRAGLRHWPAGAYVTRPRRLLGAPSRFRERKRGKGAIRKPQNTGGSCMHIRQGEPPRDRACLQEGRDGEMLRQRC